MSDRRRITLLVAAAGVAGVVGVVAAVARPDGPPTRALDGRALFADKGCAACHTSERSVAVMAGMAPSLVAAPDWAGGRVDGLSAEEYLTESIVAPSAFVSPAWGGASGPASHMPALPLDDDEVAAIVTYLLSPSPAEQG